MNVLLLSHRELFYIVWHKEMFNHNAFPLLQESELYSSFSNVAVNFGTQIRQIYEVQPSSWRYQSSQFK